MVKGIKQIVSDSIIEQRSYGFGNPANYICVHQTGNTSPGADAQAHANIQSNLNPRQASWQYQVDDKHAIQSFPDEVRCWAATDGRGPGNTESVHVEICINSDADYKKAVQNGAELVRMLADKHNAEIKQHHDFYAKNCPAQLRGNYKGISWNDFLDMVEGKPEKEYVPPKEQVKSLSVSGQRVESIYKGDEGLDFYSKPSWNDRYKVGTFGYGMGWIIRDKVKVDGYYMYEVENSKGDVYYITASEKYVKVEGSAKPFYVGKRVESHHHGDLRFYNRPSWQDEDVAGYLKHGYGFPHVLDKVKVGSGYQYKAENSRGDVYYVTASDKYVHVE